MFAQIAQRKIVYALRLSIAAIAAIGIVAPAQADMVKAVVIYDKGCGSRLVVETPGGLALVEWYGGTMPSKGDVLVGDFDKYGMQEFYDLTTDRTGRVYVDEFWLSVDRVVEKLREKCG